ncbi:MAG: hypothetical protein MK132_15430 [Lentisphaerales bacterium]|nr:hypothetical protein [Lentisphaerales bacterium]
MDRVAKNLRLFFGYQAGAIWSQLRDVQRAERSIDIYQQIIQELNKDLGDEENKRGRLVLLRSNELTDVKEKLHEKEEKHRQLNRNILQWEAKVENLIEILKTSILAVLGKSKTVEEIKADLKTDSAELCDTNKDIKRLRDSLSNAIFKQTAAMDPIRDLKFAIGHLKQEIRSCQQRKEELEEKLNMKLAEICESSSPVQIQLLFDMGLKVTEPEKFTELFLEIGALGFGKVESIEVPGERLDIEQAVLDGVYVKPNPFSCNVSINGRGYHHRKVSTNDGHAWKKRDVTFSGRINVAAKLKQQLWGPFTVAESMTNTIEKEYLLGHEKCAEKQSAILYLQKMKLKASSKELLSMLI